jgi:hypothetical protein
MQNRFMWRRTLTTGALAVVCALTAYPAHAESLSWRQTSVVASSSGATTLRKGVAILNNKETALMTVNLRAVSPPVDGKFPYTAQMTYRFAEDSTLTLEFSGTGQVTPEGRQVPGESRLTGEITAGTGRFAGAKGSFKIRVRTGLDPTLDGLLGDNFGEVDLEYTLVR